MQLHIITIEIQKFLSTTNFKYLFITSMYNMVLKSVVLRVLFNISSDPSINVISRDIVGSCMSPTLASAITVNLLGFAKSSGKWTCSGWSFSAATHSFLMARRLQTPYNANHHCRLWNLCKLSQNFRLMFWLCCQEEFFKFSSCGRAVQVANGY